MCAASSRATAEVRNRAPGRCLQGAETGEILGYEAKYIGTSELQRTGDPATVFINSTELEAIIGDRLIPAGEEKATANFTPRAPESEINGSIISILGGVSQIGQYNIVVIDRGADDGLDPGTVLRIDQRGEDHPRRGQPPREFARHGQAAGRRRPAC